MFVRNQPPVIQPLAADGRTYPDCALLPVLHRSAISVKHVCERDIPTRHNMQVAGFQADFLHSWIRNQVATREACRQLVA
jgi:hypothetical protein